MKYLDFVQTTFVEFKYDTCRRAFEDCLASLAESYDVLHKSTVVSTDTSQHQQVQNRIAEVSSSLDSCFKIKTLKIPSTVLSLSHSQTTPRLVSSFAKNRSTCMALTFTCRPRYMSYFASQP